MKPVTLAEDVWEEEGRPRADFGRSDTAFPSPTVVLLGRVWVRAHCPSTWWQCVSWAWETVWLWLLGKGLEGKGLAVASSLGLAGPSWEKFGPPFPDAKSSGSHLRNHPERSAAWCKDPLHCHVGEFCAYFSPPQ